MAPDNNRFPFLVTALTVLILALISLMPQPAQIGNWKLRKTDMFADLRAPLVRTKKRNPMAADSTTVYADTLPDYMVSTAILSYAEKSENDGLSHFLNALYKLRNKQKKKVRIAYIGDSMIEGDLISQDLRRKLQRAFGGSGVGFVPVTSVSAPNRSTVQHTFSDNWKDMHFMNSARAAYPFGLCGHIYAAPSNAWINLKGVKEERLSRFKHLALFYYNPDTLPHALTLNQHTLTLETGKGCHITHLELDSATSAVEINTDTAAPMMYGVSLESTDGITLDNYSFRGITGIELAEVTGSFFEALNKDYPYDLVILQYGPNLLFKPDLNDFSWFEGKMKKTMSYLKKQMPGTSFLIVGTADKASFTEGKWQTAIGVEPLLQTQNSLARNYHTAFWNLYTNMGGENAMVNWVEKKPYRASHDYTHLNYNGSKEVANLLYTAIMNALDKYEKKH